MCTSVRHVKLLHWFSTANFAFTPSTPQDRVRPPTAVSGLQTRRRLNIDALPAELHADAQCPGVNLIAPGRIKGDPRVIRVIQPQAALPIAHHVPDQYNGTNLAVIDERASFLYLSYSSSAGVSMCS